MRLSIYFRVQSILEFVDISVDFKIRGEKKWEEFFLKSTIHVNIIQL